MNPNPKRGDRITVTKRGGDQSHFPALVTKVGYRFFTVESDHNEMSFVAQFRLGNWAQRTLFKPDFTISRTA